MDQVNLGLLYCSYVERVHLLKEVFLPNLVLDLRPDPMQRWVVTPVHIGRRLRESPDENHHGEDRLDDQVVRAVKLGDLLVLFEQEAFRVNCLFEVIAKHDVDLHLVFAQ